MEPRLLNSDLLALNPRLTVHVPLVGVEARGVAVARSICKTGTRKIIGGGEMVVWHLDGNIHARYDPDPPGRLLRSRYTIQSARETLRLPNNLPVPDNPNCCKMKNFNDEATSGPFFRAFGVKSKAGLSDVLSDFMWSCYNKYGDGRCTERGLPHFTSRIGYRSKLLERSELEKLSEGKSAGRCVMMLDALEQCASSPIYNVISEHISRLNKDPFSGFKNTLVRASSDWLHFLEDIKQATMVIELDWKKFDRERPSEDITFIIDVIVSCFLPKSERRETIRWLPHMYEKGSH